MKIRIWKYTLAPGEQQIDMAADMVPLSVGVQGERVVMWVQLGEPAVHYSRHVYVAMTGKEFENPATPFIGTVQLPSGIVAHVYCEGS